MEGQDAQVEDQDLRMFLESGSEIAGGLIGAGVALMLSGPPGAIVGAIAQPLVARSLRSVVLDQMHRRLSRREQVRVAAVTTIAAARIRRNLNLGREPRADGFFQGRPGHRSVAEELAEGVLISAQREHEEKKIAHLGNLLANLAFAEGINRGEANLLLRIADRLSYRQICMLALFGRKDEFPELRDGTFQDQLREPSDLPDEEAKQMVELLGLLEEAEELINAGLLAQEMRLIFGHGEGLNPASAQLHRWGGVLYDLMDLTELPADDLQPLADALR